MRTIIFGAGGVGAYFGARMHAAGHDVSFVARGAHLNAMRETGLQISSPCGDLHVTDLDLTDDPGTLAPADLILMCVKLYDLDDAMHQCAALLKPGGAVLTLQNGVTGPQEAAAIIGDDKVIAGATYIACNIIEPGVLRHLGTFHRIAFGELDGQMSDRMARIDQALQAAQVESDPQNNVHQVLWEKFIPLSCIAGMTSITRATLGTVLAHEDSKAMLLQALREVVAVAHAQGAKAPDDLPQRMIEGLSKTADPDTKSSMLVDLEQGKKLELPWFSPVIVRLGAEAGIDTPAHRAIAAALAPHVHGAGASPEPASP